MAVAALLGLRWTYPELHPFTAIDHKEGSQEEKHRYRDERLSIRGSWYRESA